MAGQTFQILPAAIPVRCPMCGAEISWRYVAGRFDCPACGCGLKLRPRYFRALHLISITIDAGLAYLIGLRGPTLMSATVLLVWPTLILVTMINLRVFPPEVEISGDVRGILHPPDPQDPGRPPDPIVFGARAGDPRTPSTGLTA